MKNKRLIRLMAIIFVFVTGMNSYSDLVLCHHEDGNSSLVTGEFHEAVHCGEISHEERSCSISDAEDFHTCIDIPIQIKNITILISRISLKEKIVFNACIDNGMNRNNAIPAVSEIFPETMPDLPDCRIFKKVVLLI